MKDMRKASPTSLDSVFRSARVEIDSVIIDHDISYNFSREPNKTVSFTDCEIKGSMALSFTANTNNITFKNVKFEKGISITTNGGQLVFEKCTVVGDAVITGNSTSVSINNLKL